MPQCVDGWTVYPQKGYTDFVQDNKILRIHDDGSSEIGCLGNGGIPVSVPEAPASPPLDFSWLNSLVEYWRTPQAVTPTSVFQTAPVPVPFPAIQDEYIPPYHETIVPQGFPESTLPPQGIAVGEPYPTQDPHVEDILPPYIAEPFPIEDTPILPDPTTIVFPEVPFVEVPVMSYPKEDISPITPTTFVPPTTTFQPKPTTPQTVAPKPVVPQTVAPKTFPKVGSFIPQNSAPAPFAPVGSVVGYPTVDTFNPYSAGWTFANQSLHGQPLFNPGQIGLR